MLHNAPLSDLSSIVLFLNKERKTDLQNELIFELIFELYFATKLGGGYNPDGGRGIITANTR